MLAQARATSAPRLTHMHASRALGVAPEKLERALAGGAGDDTGENTPTGLCHDLAAAAFSVLTVRLCR
jgi:hypothetical protein